MHDINRKDYATSLLGQYVHHTKLSELFPDLLTAGRIAWLLRQRHANGLSELCIKLGRRLYVHVPSFETWLIANFADTED